MIDPDEHEAKALDYASEMGGEYLESIGKTDLGALSLEEWMTFIEAVVTGYQDRLVELLGRADDDA